MGELFKQHFVQEIAEIEIDDVTVESKCSQLVQSGYVLASLAGDADQSKNSQYPLEPGENVELSEDGKSLKAITAGFPFLCATKETDKINVMVVPLVVISKDRMQVVLNLYPPPKSEAEFTIGDLLEYISGQRIHFGIDKHLLGKKIKELYAKRQPLIDVIIGRGQLPVDGKDAYMRFEIEIGPIAGKVMGDNSIDFRERRMFIGVSEGDLIATKVPATSGVDGIDVFGEEIPAKSGKDLTVKTLDEAYYIPEKEEIRASKSGILSVVNDNNIKVSAKLSISGDVDFSTGNIISHDSVEISGSISPGFNVTTHGDLRVGGTVHTASVKSGGNVVVTGGITGKNCTIRARGDIDINFAGRVKITAGGTIVIRREAYYCKLFATGDIHCAEKSRIVGGVLASSGGFSGEHVGTPSSDPAMIAVGVGRKQYRRYLKTQKKIRKLEEKKSMYKTKYGEKDQKKTEVKKVTKKLERLQKELSGLDLQPEGLSALPDIVINGEIFAGTQLRIGNSKIVLDKDYSKIKIKFSSFSKGIEIQPL